LSTFSIRHARSFFIFLAFSAGFARAQDSFPLHLDPEVRALIDEALARNPELAASRERTAAALSRTGQAAALADPMVSIGYEKGDAWLPGRGADTGPRIEASQELPFSGKRRLMREAGARDADLTRHATEALTLSVTYAVRKALADLLLARENIAIIRDQRGATSDIEELTRARYSAGLATQLDVLRAQAEVARFDQMRLHEEGLLASATAELNRLRDRPAGEAVGVGVKLSDLVGRVLEVPSLQDVLARAQGDTPETRAAMTMVERGALAVDLARLNLKPDFVVSSAYAFRGSLPDRWSVNLGVILPAYRGSKQRLAIAEAEAELRSNRAEQQAASLRARAAIEKAYADLSAAVQEARTIERQVLVIDALAVESALAGFRSGQTPFIAVLEAHTVLYQDRRQHADLLFHILWHSALLDAFGMERQTS
jgi:outer membrane protein TolC